MLRSVLGCCAGVDGMGSVLGCCAAIESVLGVGYVLGRVLGGPDRRRTMARVDWVALVLMLVLTRRRLATSRASRRLMIACNG